jgi:outer membrane lipoprotein-sorting protein
MRFLRTVSTGRLWASIGGVAAAIAACTAVAVAATSSGPVPKREPLAQAIHQALSAKSVSGITARITFTNNLIDSSEIQGSDPLLQGGSGRMWLSSASHLLRLEIQGDNGDAQVVVRGQDFWAYDPTSHTVYEGALPSSPARSRAPKSGGVPSVAQISSTLKRVMQHAVLSGAMPSDIAGQPAYTVRMSPRQNGGLLGAVELGWDAVRGVPLRLSVFAKGDSTPALDLAVTDISYGRVAASAFSVAPPSGAKVVRLSSTSNGPSGTAHSTSGREVTGLSAVEHALPFKLDAPARLAGMSRTEVKLVHMGSRPAALVTYGQGLGGVTVLEAVGGGHSTASSSSEGQGLTPPTVSINGTTGQELDTALGSVISFARNHVAYTVLGSVTPAVARAAARGL